MFFRQRQKPCAALSRLHAGLFLQRLLTLRQAPGDTLIMHASLQHPGRFRLQCSLSILTTLQQFAKLVANVIYTFLQVLLFFVKIKLCPISL